MKKLLLAATTIAALASPAHAANWWILANNGTGWGCYQDGSSPASTMQALRNNGFYPSLGDFGDTIYVSEGEGQAGYAFYRNVQACQHDVRVVDPYR